MGKGWKSLGVHLEKPGSFEGIVGRNVDIKGNSSEVSDRNEDTGGKVILVIKWQQTWLNCVLVFFGR